MKRIINTLLGFFAAVLLFSFGSLLVISAAASKGYTKLMLDLSGYAQNIESELRSALSDIAIPSGLPADFFDDKIHSEYLDSFIEDTLDSYYAKNKAYRPDTSGLSAAIVADITAYADENNIDLDQTSGDMLKTTAEHCAEKYLNLSYGVVSKVAGIFAGMSFKLFLAAAAAALLLLLLCFLLKNDRMLYCGLLGGGVMLAAPVLLIVTGAALRWSLSSAALLGFVRWFVTAAIAAETALGVAAIVVCAVFKTKRSKKTSEETIKNT